MEPSKPVIKTNPKLLVEQLRAEANKSMAFNAVAHVFAIRERARSQVTMANLRIRMAREGFHFKAEEYEAVLKRLADFGLGSLDVGPNKRVKALKNIKVTLQSIGQAAVGKRDALERFNPAMEYQDLPLEDQLKPIAPPLMSQTKPTIAPQVAQAAMNVPQVQHKREYRAALLVMIDNAPVSFPIPKITTDKLGQLLAEFYKDGGDEHGNT